jgi:hypothetical protein
MPFGSFGTSSGGGSSIANFADPGEEHIGFTSTTGGTTITAGSANGAGTYTTLGTASGALFKGVTVILSTPSANTANFLVDISFDGGSTAAIKKLYYRGNPGGTVAYIWLPLNVQTNNTANNVKVAVQSSAGSATIKVGLIGHLNADSQARPLWDNMAADSASTSGETAVDNSNVTLGSGSGTYTSVATTSQSFGCILPVYQSSSASGNADIVCRLSTDGTDTGKFATRYFSVSSAAPTTTGLYGPPIYHAIGSGTTISAACDTASVTGTVRVGYYGFY